jgi:GxxExxY protein
MRSGDLTPEIIGAAIQVHRQLGPGLLESAYEACLAYELDKLGLRVERQKPVPVVYDSVKLDCGFRADLVVGSRVVVELKCKDTLHPVDQGPVALSSPAAAHSRGSIDQLSRRSSQGRHSTNGQ